MDEQLLKRTLDGYVPGLTLEGQVISLLVDLRHLCDEQGISHHLLDGVAYQHYANELVEGAMIPFPDRYHAKPLPPALKEAA
jgi:hypothetical protein